MAPSESNEPDDTLALPEEDLEGEAQEGAADEAASEEEEEKIPLKLEVDIQTRGACQRHIIVKVSREDIDRYLDKEYSELVTSAQVPGFRPGHAPRKLIERRFRKEASERVKTGLLVDSIAQLSEESDLSPISEPDFDLEAVELPDDGPMTYEFDLEVRPEFDLPEWKGLRIERPVREFTDQDVDVSLRSLLTRYGQLAPHDGPAEMGDYIATGLTFVCEGQTLSSAPEELIRIRPVLSFRDGKIEDFGEVMQGVRAGQSRTGQAVLSEDAPNVAFRGKTITAQFDVKEVKRVQLPEMNHQFLDSIGGFESEAELRDAVRDNLQRQLEYHQRQRAREQITAALTVAADWELPPELLKRQAQRELDRAAMELRRSGFSDPQIRAYENELRQNSLRVTAKALKEHFILERLAEEEHIQESEQDYDDEIELIAEQSGETPRRVKARLEKSGRMDVLRNQIIERKAIDLILQHATFRDIPWQPEALEAEAIDRSAGGEEAAEEEPEQEESKQETPEEKQEG
jgi:trigger factor